VCNTSLHQLALYLFGHLFPSYSLLSDDFSDSSSDDSTFPGLDILCRPSSLRPTNSTGTGDIANASCCRGNSSPSTSSANSSSSDSITNETSIAGKRPKRYYCLQILPNQYVKVQLDRLELLAMLDRYSTPLFVTVSRLWYAWSWFYAPCRLRFRGYDSVLKKVGTCEASRFDSISNRTSDLGFDS